MSIAIPPTTITPALDSPKQMPKRDWKAGDAQFPMELYRSKGVEIIPDDPEPYGAFLKLLSGFKVRWGSDHPHKVLSSPNKRAEMLDWNPSALRVVEDITGIISTLPRRCPGKVTTSKLKSMTADSQTCPCSYFYGNDPDVWKGCTCPGEAVKTYRHFVRYVRELGIRENDHVDIQQVMDIIQLHLIEDRCTENIHIAGLFEDTAKIMRQSTGDIEYDRKASEAILLKANCQKQRTDLYAKLLATRSEREKMRSNRVKEKQEDKKADAVNNLADLFTQIRQSNVIESEDILSLDADFSDE